MADERHVPGPSSPRTAELQTPESRRLWFGTAGGAVAWVLLGCFDLVVTWRACMQQEEWGLPPRPATATVLYLVVSLLLLATTVVAGFSSYRNWRRYSTREDLVHAKANDRREFMSMAGVLVAITLGMGIVWLALPPLFLDLCWRAR